MGLFKKNKGDKMKIQVDLDGYEMKRLFAKATKKKAKLFAQDIIDRYCSGEYLDEERLEEDLIY